MKKFLQLKIKNFILILFNYKLIIYYKKINQLGAFQRQISQVNSILLIWNKCDSSVDVEQNSNFFCSWYKYIVIGGLLAWLENTIFNDIFLLFFSTESHIVKHNYMYHCIFSVQHLYIINYKCDTLKYNDIQVCICCM